MTARPDSRRAVHHARLATMSSPDRPSVVRIASGIVFAATTAATAPAAAQETIAVSKVTTSPPSRIAVPITPSGPIPGRAGSRQFP